MNHKEGGDKPLLRLIKRITSCKSSQRKISSLITELLVATATSQLNVVTWFTLANHSTLLRISSSPRDMTSQLTSGKEIDMTFQVGDKVEMNISNHLADTLDRFDIEVNTRGIGEVIEQTPYKVHVRWAPGKELAHHPQRIKKVQ